VSGFAASPPDWSADRAVKPTKMYVGGRIVKQKGLPQLAWDFQAFLSAGALIQRCHWFDTGLLRLTFSTD
jgi:hypothetical protein